MNNRQPKDKQPVFVLGGTGKTGQRIVQRLQERRWPVRIGSRTNNPKFDWLDQTTWKPALEGIKAVYISFQPDLAVPGSDDAIRAFTQTAVQCGVKQLVLLSGRGEPEAQVCEQIVMNAGADWTILRASWFNQNFSEGYLIEPILEGFVALPAENIPEPFIDTDDIADVAVAALTENGHDGQLYELTGPRLLTFKNIVEEISRATGRKIHYEPISIDAYKSAMVEHGVPQEYVDLLTYLFTVVLDGRNASVADGVERALGRQPIDFSEYARKTAATGVWNQVVA
ncbi:Prestalk A differentiation protein A [Fibrisoma limi BUZ 3]|uniref:Prestalk A differentiation protein A n=1 Tax=Fibrisoma limi BUZ 3 TaxID=1185876 RepID=I2GG44_9BACT|nr:NAD(P)H-binding protein [Fibrisoma limi]CCH52869.1 Prestalk A differentiation protein A [Fibrisoma limi BUZ 3]